MSDFVCKEAKDMYYTELSSGVKHFKEEEGRELMCQAVEEYAKKKAKEAAIEAEIKAGIAYGVEKKQIIVRMCEEYGISEEEAEELYNAYVMMAV